MKIGLRTKYTILLAGLALSASLVIGAIFLFQIHDTVEVISAVRISIVKDARAYEVRERGHDLAELVSTSLGSPLKLSQKVEIDNVAKSALAVKDVVRVAVYDAQANLLHDSSKSVAPIKQSPVSEIRDRVLGQGKWLAMPVANRQLIVAPIRQDGKILGAVSLTMGDGLANSAVGQLHRALDNLWHNARGRFFDAVILMVVLFVVSSVSIGAYAARRLSAPVEAFAVAATRIGEGRYDISLPQSDQDEFGDLALALGHMADDLKKSTVSVNYLNGIIGNMREGLVVADEDGRIEKINRAACELSGYSEEELIGQPVERLLTLQTDSEGNAASASSDSAFSVPSSLRAKSGAEVPILVSEADIKSHVDVAPRAVFVFNDITGIRQREAELGAARDEAQIANRAKSQFLATMSHELRTPLNAIIGFSSMLKDQIGGPLNEKSQSYATDIYESADHLLMIINDLLDISKLEAGKMELTEEPVELSEVVHAAVRLVREKARAKGIEIESIGVDTVPAIFGDRRMAKQMVTNLMSNAFKFNREGGRITVEAVHDPASGLDLSVTDTGIGIAKEDMSRIALPFSQVENHISRNFQGTGLGLAITKSMMEMHGGKLLIESEKGKGTKVTLHFPPSRVEDA